MHIKFQLLFINDIISHKKVSTIRNHEKPQCKAGDILNLHCGAEHKDGLKIGTSVCKSIHKFVMSTDGKIYIDETKQGMTEIVKLSKQEGFKSVLSMQFFFLQLYGNENHVLDSTFQGYQYCWSDFKISEQFLEIYNSIFIQ